MQLIEVRNKETIKHKRQFKTSEELRKYAKSKCIKSFMIYDSKLLKGTKERIKSRDKKELQETKKLISIKR